MPFYITERKSLAERDINTLAAEIETLEILGEELVSSIKVHQEILENAKETPIQRETQNERDSQLSFLKGELMQLIKQTFPDSNHDEAINKNDFSFIYQNTQFNSFQKRVGSITELLSKPLREERTESEKLEEIRKDTYDLNGAIQYEKRNTALIESKKELLTVQKSAYFIIPKGNSKEELKTLYDDLETRIEQTDDPNEKFFLAQIQQNVETLFGNAKLGIVAEEDTALPISPQEQGYGQALVKHCIQTRTPQAYGLETMYSEACKIQAESILNKKEKKILSSIQNNIETLATSNRPNIKKFIKELPAQINQLTQGSPSYAHMARVGVNQLFHDMALSFTPFKRADMKRVKKAETFKQFREFKDKITAIKSAPSRRSLTPSTLPEPSENEPRPRGHSS